MQDFRNLKVWQKSIAANIAEGSGRSGDKEFARFLYIALGSASELEYFFILIADLDLLKKSEAANIETDAVEIKRMLSGLIASFPIQRSRATD